MSLLYINKYYFIHINIRNVYIKGKIKIDFNNYLIITDIFGIEENH